MMAALTPGTRLGPYEVLTPLGAGGMGEVYKARDTRLDRTVAIKVLAATIASDAAVRARFEREARTISALDHPNICVLHDVGREGDVDYLVMQYLDGETLAERLSRGALPLEDALRHGTEIASALDKAHRAGILHRDLKPGNVMLVRSSNRDTTAKLLDFGLAKLAAPRSLATPQTQQATFTSPLTGQGAIVGTLLYMSPEQLEGRELDARSDIFSFGTVLYEMVTGQRAFNGPSQASIIASILERDPQPIGAHAPLTPPALDRVVRKCLAKHPDRRWQSASDLCDELSWISQSSAVHAQPASGTAGRRPRVSWRTVAVAVMLLSLAAVAGWAVWTRTAAALPPPIARSLSVSLADEARLTPGGIAVSPDGKTIVYAAATHTATGEGQRPTMSLRSTRLYVRRFDEPMARPLSGTEGARTPFFSPDGNSIAFFTESLLVKLSLLGGAPVTIMSVPPVTRGGVWLPDDTIVFTPSQSSPLMRVSVSGADLRPVALPDVKIGEKAYLWPSLVPGATDILYSIRRGTTSSIDEADVGILNVGTRQSRVILRGAAHPRLSPTGHLLFVRGRTLMAAVFDPRQQEITATPFPLVQDIAVDPWIGGAHYAVAGDGTVLFVRGSFPAYETSALWVDRSGKPLALPGLIQRHLGKPRISPDGNRAVFDGTTAEGDSEVYVAVLRLGTAVRFSGDPQDDFNPIWSADGTKIIWTALPAARLPFLAWRNADGTGPAEEVFPANEAQFAGSVSPEGVLTYAQTLGRSCDIWTVPLRGERVGRPFITGPAHEYGPEFSPDGRWIAFISDEAGSSDVYVVPYPGPGGKRRVTTGGGAAVSWRRDGKELFYQTAAGLIAVPVTYGGDIEFGAPRLLFAGNFVSNSREDGPRQYDVTAAGDRFLMVTAAQSATGKPPALEVLLNWWTDTARGR